MLGEVEEALRDRRRDLGRVDADLDSATDRCPLEVTNRQCCCPLVFSGGVDGFGGSLRRLAAALSDCRGAQNHLDSLCKQVHMSSMN